MGRLAPAVVSGAVVLAAFIGVLPVAVAAVGPTVQGLSVADWLRTFDAAAVDLPQDFRSPYGPMALQPDAHVVVMLKLPGDPVALVKARTPDLTPAQKEAIRADLRARQDALRPTIQALGGRVLGQYQVAYNGMKIEIARSRLVDLASLHVAVEVSPVQAFRPANTNGVPLIGAPAVWGGSPTFRGEGIKIAIIDTGVDYTHADFGGPGTEDAYLRAHANETLPADPTMFGPNAPKVKGGTDLVGDNYTGDNAPAPDPNPLDCNGHGSHVAGTAAGFGVTAAGATYRGPYDASTFSPPGKFDVGPGVAPLADLYAVRVFGCEGFTRLTVDAIEWAVNNNMDVINMSLGSIFGMRDDPTAEASDNAAKAGVIVVASAGNSGPSPYMTGAPAAADTAISVAASDAVPSVLAARAALSTGSTIFMQNSNGAAFSDGTTLPIKVLRNADGTVSLGCQPSEYANVTGTLVVTLRGTCARVARAIYGEKAGAAAVAMINTAPGYPPIEDKITRNPDTGEPFTVTIPFFGVRGSDRGTIVGADRGNATLTNTVLANPGFKSLASFTSGGPRTGDSVLKPDLTAPGVSVRSTAMGTGNTGTRLSGTSMAAPHVSGVAALVRQAHPNWSVEDVKAAIVDTGNPDEVVGYTTRLAGTGLVQAVPATTTTAVAVGVQPYSSLSFGFAELGRDFSGTQALLVRNHGTTAVTFTLSSAASPGSAPHAVGFGEARVVVPANETVGVNVVLNVTAATVGDSRGFREVAGLVVLTPDAGQNGDVVLRVPYYLVPRPLSTVDGKASPGFGPRQPFGSVTLTNRQGVIPGNADFYAWGLQDAKENLGPHDLRAVGVQSFPAPTPANPDRRLLVFAVNTWEHFSNAASNEFDVLLDVNGDGTDDFAVIGFDVGRLTTGSFDGRMGSWVLNLAKGTLAIDFLATAPTDSSTVLLPVYSTRIGVGLTNPRFTYHAHSYSLLGLPDDSAPGTAKFNAYTPAISNGAFVTVAPGATATVLVLIDVAEWIVTSPLGLMIVVLDNSAGSGEALLLPVK
ncbi:MAG TPA: S8 family serine peptidase [Thermoplasmata archaeon]|nr:S8 family serine peptidase [Thermoplasmata archaeon]